MLCRALADWGVFWTVWRSEHRSKKKFLCEAKAVVAGFKHKGLEELPILQLSALDFQGGAPAAIVRPQQL